MPVPLRTTFHKADAKYNVTTEFPSLGLHSAAATGNVGLVEYALDHGQPINSVLDGVLPLHAACAGGNVQVVKVLIDHGADVNAPRLPRKYSNDKNRDSSAPIVGTSGSTPLHFAAANGNTGVVSLLLLHGAHADRADKHGVTPEMLAQQNGWIECAKVLREWILNKDRDLREREGYDMRTGSSSGIAGQDSSELNVSASPRRRLHVKQSIDTALNILKCPEPHSKMDQLVHTSTPPASPLRPFGEYTFHAVEPSNSPINPGSRRPSLPHIRQLPSNDTHRNRKPSSSVSTDTPSQRRPSSAGTGADRSDRKPGQEVVYPVYGRGGSGRKLGTKYSLMNIFKKAQSGDGSESYVNTPDTGSTRESSGVSSAAIPGSTVTLPLPMTPGNSAQTSNPDLPEGSGIEPIHPSRTIFAHRGSDASSRNGRITPHTQTHTASAPLLPRKPSGTLHTPPRTNTPLAIELHLALAQQQRMKPGVLDHIDSPGQTNEGDNVKAPSPLARLNPLLHNRNRSISSISAPPDAHSVQTEEVVNAFNPNPDPESGKPSPSPRPGILRAHNRTSSTGQGSPLNSRTLRFDSTSSTPSSERKGKDSPRSIPPMLRSCNSAGSLTKLNIQTNRDGFDAGSNEETISIVPADKRDTEPEVDDQEEHYGDPTVPLEHNFVGEPNLPSVLLQRQRGLSFASSSESSLSPILSNDNANDPALPILNSDFPFSINRPPSLSPEDQTEDISPNSAHLNVPVSPDTRNRGDSLSSDSTTDSRSNTQTSSSATSGSGASGTVFTPGLSGALMLVLDGDKSLDKMKQLEISSDDDEGLRAPQTFSTFGSSINERRARTPLDIDVTSISSHAQAEALVQRARQEVLDLAGTQDLSPMTASTGRTPLSARLAAYGESLALERKLREQKESEENYWKGHAQDAVSIQSSRSTGQVLSPATATAAFPREKSRDGVERQLSLENKSASRVKRMVKDPRRPSTADGLSSGRKPDSFFTERSPSHQSSRSATASASNYSSVLQDDTRKRSFSPHHNYQPSISQPLQAASPDPDYSQSLPRARTPVNTQDESLSRISSTDDAETETDTAPPIQSIFPAISSTRGKREQGRSAKKLTRMGYPVAEQAAAASRAAPPTPPTTKRFGIKSLMQTFKGKA